MPLINGPEEFGPNHPTPVQWTSAPTKVCKPDDILYCVRGNTTGRMNIADREYCIGRGIASIRGISGRSDTFFLRYLLNFRNPELYSIARAGGSTFPNLGRSQSADLPVSIPQSLNEQRAIARVLEAIQLAKQARQRELALEQERKDALMEWLFSHGTRGETTKQTEIGEVPQNWQVAPLRNVCKSSAFGPRFGAELYSEKGNVAVLRTTDFDDDGNIDYATVPRAQLELEKFKSHILEPGDFLITRSGTCGIASVFQGHSMNVLPGAFLIRFRLSSQLSPEFLRHYVNSATGSHRVQKVASGAIQKNLTSTSLLSLCVPIPPPIEQESVNRVAACCNEKIWALECEVQLLNEAFGAMLEELMTGRLSAVPLIEKHQPQ